MKVLIVCLPNGMLVYASKPYEGSISDRQIIIESGFLEMLDEGDVVLGNISTLYYMNLFYFTNNPIRRVEILNCRETVQKELISLSI